MPIVVGQRVLCAPFGIGRVDRTVGAAVEGIPAACFVVVIDVAGLNVRHTGDGRFSLGDVPRGFEAIVPMDRAERLLRPLAGREEAEAALARLVPGAVAPVAPAGSFSERLHAIDHVLRSGDLARMAALLAERLPALVASDADTAVPFGERKSLHAIERLVVGELAIALDRPADALLDEIRGRFR